MPTGRKTGQPTQETISNESRTFAISNDWMIYIPSGIAFTLLLVLCFILGFWCYRRSHHKRMKRLFAVVVTTYDETYKHNKFIIYCKRNGAITGEILQLEATCITKVITGRFHSQQHCFDTQWRPWKERSHRIYCMRHLCTVYSKSLFCLNLFN